jgi:hypothetical protein
MPLKPYAKHRGTIYNIDLAAPPSRRWKQAAEDFGNNVHALLANLEAKLEEELSNVGSNFLPRWAKKQTVRAGLRTAARIARSFGRPYVKECDAIADVVDVDADDLLAANLAYDLLGLYLRRPRLSLPRLRLPGLGCSSVSYNDSQGHPVLARTLDWEIPESIGEHSIHVRFHKGKEHYDALTVAGFVGVLSAQRPYRWAMTVNMAPQGNAKIRQVAQMPVCMHLRQCADRAITYDELCRKIQATQTGSPFFVHVVGIQSGERTIITGHGEEYEQRDPENDGPLIITNHHLDLDDDDQGWDPDALADSQKRYRTVERRIRRNPHLAIASAAKLMAGSRITSEITQQSMVLSPATNYLDWKVLPNSDWEVCEVACPWCDCTHTINQGVGTYTCDECGGDFDVK